MMNKKVVIVMPAYNAAKTIEKTYRDIPDALRNNGNIILVDDGSRDETILVAKKLGIQVIVHEQNKGYGANQKTCYNEALKLGGDIIVMIHPDYQYDSSMTEELIRPIKDGWLDIMLGNRIRTRKEALAGGMPSYKYLGNRLLTIIENIALGLNLGEFHSGFRAYSRSALKKIPYEHFSDDFVFDQEMLISSAYKGLRMGEIPVPVRYFAEASSINFSQSVKYGIMTLLTIVKFYMQRIEIKKYAMFNSS